MTYALCIDCLAGKHLERAAPSIPMALQPWLEQAEQVLIPFASSQKATAFVKGFLQDMLRSANSSGALGLFLTAQVLLGSCF